jgi:hypothetical protein
MKDKILIKSRPLGERLDRDRLLTFAWSAGIKEYTGAGLMAGQWQMFYP